MNPKPNPRKTGEQAQEAAAQLADDIAEFQEYRSKILPALRRDLEAGLSAQEIMKKYASYAAAKTVSISMLESDSGKALAASKDIIDRADGKAKETKDIHHKYEGLTPDELDAQVLARAEEMLAKTATKASPGGGARATEGANSKKPLLN